MKKYKVTELLCSYISCNSKRLLFVFFFFFFFFFFSLSAQISISSNTEIHITNGAMMIIASDSSDEESSVQKQVELYTADNSSALNIYKSNYSLEEDNLLNNKISITHKEKAQKKRNLSFAKQIQRKVDVLKKNIPQKNFTDKVIPTPLPSDLKINCSSRDSAIAFTIVKDYQIKSATILRKFGLNFLSCESEINGSTFTDTFILRKINSDYSVRPPPVFSYYW